MRQEVMEEWKREERVREGRKRGEKEGGRASIGLFLQTPIQ